jgi:hypothetical protein
VHAECKIPRRCPRFDDSTVLLRAARSFIGCSCRGRIAFHTADSRCVLHERAEAHLSTQALLPRHRILLSTRGVFARPGQAVHRAAARDTGAGVVLVETALCGGRRGREAVDHGWRLRRILLRRRAATAAGPSTSSGGLGDIMLPREATVATLALLRRATLGELRRCSLCR